MTLSCPVCADLLLITESASSTPCGHIFHESCLNRWLSSNRSCPHCRAPCPLSSAHRVYLPESHFEKNDILEKLNEVAIAKLEQEKAIKELEKNNKKLEFELKAKKKQYQKILSRSRRISKHSKTINIPRAELVVSSSSSHGNSTAAATSSSSTSTSRVVNQTSQSAEKNVQNASRSTHNGPKKRRNISRVSRAKAYFRRKKDFFRNAVNNQAVEIVDTTSEEEDNDVTMAI